jgi:hypothetical protein
MFCLCWRSLQLTLFPIDVFYFSTFSPSRRLLHFYRRRFLLWRFVGESKAVSCTILSTPFRGSIFSLFILKIWKRQNLLLYFTRKAVDRLNSNVLKLTTYVYIFLETTFLLMFFLLRDEIKDFKTIPSGHVYLYK